MGNWNEQLRKLAIAAGMSGIGLTGCNDSSDAPKPGENSQPNGEVRSVKQDSSGNEPKSSAADSPEAVNFDQSFSKAASTEVLEGQFVPPDVTVAGKRTGQLREAVEELWPKIKLIDAAGKPIVRVLHIETSEGPIEISLRPKWRRITCAISSRSPNSAITTAYFSSATCIRKRTSKARKADSTC